MKKTLKILHAAFGIRLLFGVIFGPISWVSSAIFFREYTYFEKEATLIDGKVVSKRFKNGFRSGIDYVTIKYVHDKKGCSREITIERPLWTNLHSGQEVSLLHNSKKKDCIKLKMENESRFVPPLLKMGLGKWTTILSFSFLLLQITFKNKINKKVGWKSEKKGGQ